MPTFGAIPSAKDLEMKKKEEEELADKADEIWRKILSKDAFERLTFTESSEPKMVTALLKCVVGGAALTRACWCLARLKK